MVVHTCKNPTRCEECWDRLHEQLEALEAQLQEAQEEAANRELLLAQTTEAMEEFAAERDKAIERGEHSWRTLKAAVEERIRMVAESMALASAWQRRAEKAEQQLADIRAKIEVSE